MSSTPTAPYTLPPCLIREPLYAPPCPAPAAALFDVALVLQNEGKFAFAINTTLKAQQAWEQCLLEEHYPDIEDKIAHSILLRLRQKEKRELEAAEAERLLREAEENGYDDEEGEEEEDDEEVLLRQMEELANETDEAAEARVASQRAAAAAKKRSAAAAKKNAAAAAEAPPSAADLLKKKEEEEAALDPNAIFLQQQQQKMQQVMEEAARRKAEEEEAAQIAFDNERERKRQEKVQALHQVYQMLPIEGKIFIQLRLCSIYESAGDDEKALATALYALKFVQTLPIYLDHTIAATIYTVLGNIYAHLSQFDYAADYLFRALEIRSATLGEEHVDTATVMHNIGCVLQGLGKPNDALVCFYKSLGVFQRLLPASHPRIELCEANIRKGKEMQFRGLVTPPVPPVGGFIGKKK